MHSSEPSPSATTESRNEMHLADVSAEELSADEMAIIFSFLPPVDIMCLRQVCTTWKDAAKKTLVPESDFVVNNLDKYNAMATITTALPNLQELSICNLGPGHKYSDGEDPDEDEAALIADYTAHDIDIISRFTNLRSLKILRAGLNGRYPVLFNFPLLQNLSIRNCWGLKWDLEVLSGLPSLKELDCYGNLHLTGSLSSLRVLKDTLEKAKILYCDNIRGNFMDLADFPRLKELDLRETDVTGDIRDIRGHDFTALGSLFLPKSVHGGIGCEIQHVAEVPSLIHAIHLLLQRTPDLFEENGVSQAFYSKLRVDSVRSYNTMRVMSTALPTLQQILIWGLEEGHKYSDGEDPDEEEAAETADDTAHDIDIISSFRELRSLEIWDSPLNGRYPVLFNFPLLQNLSIRHCWGLKWDLEVLSGLPSLKELYCYHNLLLTGSLSSLRVLKDTLEKVRIFYCDNIRGNFMDLADFPRLKELDLRETDVTGDIRDIREHDFTALVSLSLPDTVHGGGIGYEFQNVADVPSFMQAIHLLLQRSPTIFGESHLLSGAFDWSLSRDSPDWYEWERGSPPPPFHLQFVQAGSRRGWSWCWSGGDWCEINWLDPEPSIESWSNYEAYIEDVPHIERRINFYRGYHEPPTEVEYHRLCEGLLP